MRRTNPPPPPHPCHLTNVYLWHRISERFAILGVARGTGKTFLRQLSFLSMARQPLVGQGGPHFENSRSHSDLVGLLWTSDQPDAETSTWQTQHSQETDVLHSAGFEPTILASGRPQTHALDRATSGTGRRPFLSVLHFFFKSVTWKQMQLILWLFSGS